MDHTSDTRRRRDHELAAPLGRVASGRLVIGPRAAGSPCVATHHGRPVPGQLRVSAAGRAGPGRDRHRPLPPGGMAHRSPRRARPAAKRPGDAEHLDPLACPGAWRHRHTSFDLRALILYALELGGGVSNVEVLLPTPAGTVPVRVAGGVHHLTVLRPAGVAARVRVGHGARRLTLDDQHFGAIGAAPAGTAPTTTKGATATTSPSPAAPTP